MPARIDAELLKQLERFEVTEPKRQIPVIITLNDWAGRAELEKKGLRVTHAFDSISAVSGTIEPSALREVAQMGQVEKVEFDGEVRAI